MPMEHVPLPSVALPMRRLRTDGPSMGFLMRTDQAANSHTGGWKSTVIELRPPRGVKKEDYARKNIYDVWFPTLAPREDLLNAVAVDVRDHADGPNPIRTPALGPAVSPRFRGDIRMFFLM